MKSLFKKIGQGCLIIAVMLLLFGVSSCERNKCKTRGIECKNGGQCFDGLCNCPPEWTGKLCDTAINFKFLGRFGGIKVYDNGYATGDTIIIAAQGLNKILIGSPSGSLPYAALVENNQFSVDKFAWINNYVINGTGVVNKDRVSLTMNVDSVVNGIKLKSFRYAFSGDRVP